MIYDSFNDFGQEIGIELVLKKTVSSTSNVTYRASIFAPPAISASTRNNAVGGQLVTAPRQRTIAVTVKPDVDVETFAPRNILAFVGSIAGILPVFISLGGIICSVIWSRKSENAIQPSETANEP